MSLRNLPKINALSPISGVQWDPPSDAMNRWNAAIQAADSDDATLSIYSVIGENWEGDGMTARRVAGFLRHAGSKDVTVSINSPGGDFFEGVAIYNLLREHPHKVTVQVLGLAASAASVIAMAGDDIQIAKTGFLMIHNAWAVAIGNRHDFLAAAEVLAPFDDVMAGLYADRSGRDKVDMAAMMDAETWISWERAIELGLADNLLSADALQESEESESPTAALRQLDVLLAKQGLPRSERRQLIKQIRGTPGAAADAMPCAGSIIADLESALTTLRTISTR